MPTAPMIALVTRLSDAAEAELLALLGAALPGETVRSLRALSEADRAAVDIAVVANPDPADLAALPGLVWVHSLWAGVERLLAELPDFRRPIVRLVDPELARTMSEAALAWTYYLFRDMPAYARQQRARHWHPLPYRRPGAVTVGVLGLGKLGAAAATRIAAQGFDVTGWSRSPKALAGIRCRSGADGLAQLLAEADIAICLLPLTPATRGLLNAAALARMKPGAGLINFARGPIVETDALLEALEAGRPGHAVLDVFDREPLSADSPLWSHPGVTVLPHVSGPTDPGTGAEIVAAAIRGYRETGEIPPAVDPARGY